MITVQALLDGGYRKYKSLRPGTRALYQKRIKTGDKTRYFINVDEWDWDPYPQMAEAVKARNALSVNCRMYMHLNGYDVEANIDLLLEPDLTVTDVEAFYENAYERLGCVPDRQNNDT